MAQLGSTGEGFFVQFRDGCIFVELVKHVKARGVLLKRTDVSCVLQKESKEVYTKKFNMTVKTRRFPNVLAIFR